MSREVVDVTYASACATVRLPWYRLMWRKHWQSQVDLDINRTFRVNRILLRRSLWNVRVFCCFQSTGYVQGLLFIALPLHKLFRENSVAFWALVRAFGAVRPHYGPVVYSVSLGCREDCGCLPAEKVVTVYRRCGAIVPPDLVDVVVSFVRFRVLCTLGAAICSDIKSATEICLFMWRRKLCDKYLCAFALQFLLCVCGGPDEEFKHRTNVRLPLQSVRLLLDNVDYVAHLF